MALYQQSHASRNPRLTSSQSTKTLKIPTTQTQEKLLGMKQAPKINHYMQKTPSQQSLNHKNLKNIHHTSTRNNQSNEGMKKLLSSCENLKLNISPQRSLALDQINSFSTHFTLQGSQTTRTTTATAIANKDKVSQIPLNQKQQQSARLFKTKANSRNAMNNCVTQQSQDSNNNCIFNTILDLNLPIKNSLVLQLSKKDCNLPKAKQNNNTKKEQQKLLNRSKSFEQMHFYQSVSSSSNILRQSQIDYQQNNNMEPISSIIEMSDLSQHQGYPSEFNQMDRYQKQDLSESENISAINRCFDYLASQKQALLFECLESQELNKISANQLIGNQSDSYNQDSTLLQCIDEKICNRVQLGQSNKNKSIDLSKCAKQIYQTRSKKKMIQNENSNSNLLHKHYTSISQQTKENEFSKIKLKNQRDSKFYEIKEKPINEENLLSPNKVFKYDATKYNIDQQIIRQFKNNHNKISVIKGDQTFSLIDSDSNC
ncbi:UNKNOWN [Stylonychia lemnae]|uniref:Uncharacterized protein n=1 Tax=Stylonychia lemnae TaxID=5949 RepID=A0A077ZQK5_STYLE|nr:UNKNOWN [Stylonychia lemnae]|eukprot:CDW72203.1 UNKNOWN [Stylonychia lemnae]